MLFLTNQTKLNQYMIEFGQPGVLFGRMANTAPAVVPRPRLHDVTVLVACCRGPFEYLSGGSVSPNGLMPLANRPLGNVSN